MSDLHERLSAAVNERLELARKATPGPWDCHTVHPFMDGRVQARIAPIGKPKVLADVMQAVDMWFIAANDPATVIRHCERDLKVLGMHQWRAPGVNCGCDKAMCSCGEHVPWPCEELVWLATAYAIDSALPSRPPVERGTGSPAPPR